MGIETEGDVHMKKYKQIFVFDLETTGFKAGSDDIIDVGGVVLKPVGLDYLSEQSINELVKTDKILSEKIVNLTGITQAMSQSGITDKALYLILKPLLDKDTLLVAYNMQFDIGFIDALMKRHEPAFTMRCDLLDLLTVYKDMHPYPHKLENALKTYNIDIEHAHRAFDDALATSKLFRILRDNIPLSAYINHIGYHEKYGLSGIRYPHVRYWPQSYQTGTFLKKIRATQCQ